MIAARATTLELWYEALGGMAVTLASEDVAKHPRNKAVVLRQALVDRTLNQTFNARSIGRYLARYKDRLAGGRVLRCIDDSSGVKRYRVEVSGSDKPEDVPLIISHRGVQWTGKCPPYGFEGYTGFVCHLLARRLQ